MSLTMRKSPNYTGTATGLYRSADTRAKLPSVWASMYEAQYLSATLERKLIPRSRTETNCSQTSAAGGQLYSYISTLRYLPEPI